jgi:hypothetical protein
MPIQEKKLIRLSLIILFLSLLMVYLLLYQIKGKNIKQSLTPETNNWQGIIITVNSWDETTIVEPETIQELSYTGKKNIGTIGTNTWAFTQSPTSLSWIHMLSWTKLFYGKIDSIEKLGIKYQYALLDSSWTFLINLGAQTYDFDSITRALGWNIYKITTEQELAKNKLFGNKVLYINLPEYKDKLVLMLEYIGQEVRLIQIDYTLYHTSKWYLKTLFTQ